MSIKTYTNSKIAFIHGRPAPHPTHTALAQSINADFFPVDKILRYHDLENSSKFKKYLSWLLNSVLFKDIEKYDLIIAEGMHITPVIMKLLRILRKDQKIASMLGNEFLFFVQTKWYPPKTLRVLEYSLSKYDSLLCMSKFQTELANKIFEGKKTTPQIITAHEIISSGRSKPDESSIPKLDKHRLLFVAHGPNGWRGYYKGIETLLQTFNLLSQKYIDIQLTVVGDWDDDYINNLIKKTGNVKNNLNFVGRQNDLISIFKNSDLCVHLTNGDAFPIATLESMRAGLPTMVSNLTGTKEVVSKIDENLVVEMDPIAASERIEWYFNLSPAEKQNLSSKGREVLSIFSEKQGIEEFRNAVNQALN